MGYICIRISSNAIKRSQLHRSYFIRRQASLFEYISELCNNATYITHIKNALMHGIYLYNMHIQKISRRYHKNIFRIKDVFSTSSEYFLTMYIYYIGIIQYE